MIDQELLQQFEEKFNKPCRNRASRHAIARVGLQEASLNNNAIRKHPFVFSHETQHGKITNQKATGRCWMFAALNTMRVGTMEQLNLETFEYSQTYPLFWDKLERSNYVLDSIIETADQPLNSRLVWHLLQQPIQDGGQWEMFAGILTKYGAVPKEVMPETYHSSNTAGLNSLLTNKLREFAARLRQMHEAGADRSQLLAKKEEQLYFIYSVLVKALGQVPTVFDYAYRDKDNQYHKLSGITPQEFFKQYGGVQLDEMVSLINAPTQDKPFGKPYTIQYLASIAEAKPIKYLNVPIDVMKQAAVDAIKSGQPVWFGCDVGKFSERKYGIMDDEMYAYADTLGESFTLSKAERLDYSDSMLTHAMVFVGVDLDDQGQPLTWKVENSWGKTSGDEGIYSMSDKWFEEYTYQITVPRQFIPSEWLEDYDQEAIKLEPWDPMGALAYLN